MLSMSCPTSDLPDDGLLHNGLPYKHGRAAGLRAWAGRLLWAAGPLGETLPEPGVAPALVGGICRAGEACVRWCGEATRDAQGARRTACQLPSCLSTGTQSRKAERRLLLLLGAGTSDYLDALTTPDCSDAALEAGLDELLRRGDWDRMVLTQPAPALQATERCARLGREECAAVCGRRMCAEGPAVPIRELPTKIRRNAMYLPQPRARGWDAWSL